MPERVQFFFDPICPWAWITSRWIVELTSQKVVDPTWSFISLTLVNEGKDYEKEFPVGYTSIHGLGHRLLRVAAATREQFGNEAVGRFYTATGEAIHNEGRRSDYLDGGSIDDILAKAGLPDSLAAALDDEVYDKVIRMETDLALSRTGKDVGTPIITLLDRQDSSFFGPVMSSIPKGEDARRLFDAYLTFTAFADFCEIKRAIRSAPVFN